MQVFKSYFKILFSMKFILILYFGIFMTLTIVMTSVLSSEGGKEFSYTSLNLSVIDYDNKGFGEAVKTHFGDVHEFIEVKDDEDYILEEFYWKAIDYVLIVPEGFEDSLTTDSPLALQCRKIPGDFDSSYFETELSQYASKLVSLVKSGYSMTEATDMLLKSREEKSEIKMASYVNTNQNDKLSNFFMYVPYLFISLCMSCIGNVLVTFNDKDLKNRIECSSLPLQKRSAYMIAGVFTSGIILLIAVCIIAGILTGGKLFTDSRALLFIGNAFVMLLFSLCLGYFTGIVSTSKDSVNGMVNVLSLALCFLGGIFVPLELFGNEIVNVAKFTPTYWYAMSNDLIASTKSIASANLQSLGFNWLVITCFAVAFLAAAIVVQNLKRKEA